MKRMTKRLSLFMAAALVLSMLAGCGGSGVRADEEYQGKYVAVTGEMLGYALSGDEMAGFDLELLEKGKVNVTIDGEGYNAKWSNDDTNIILDVDGVEMKGEIGTDTIKFADMLGMGVDITFAKEGTDAANPENYLPEEEKKCLGVWKSYQVTDSLGDDASGEVAADALELEFKGDKSAVFTYKGNEIGTFPWSMWSGFGSFEDEKVSSTWEFVDDEIEFTYTENDDYYIFTCAKQ